MAGRAGMRLTLALLMAMTLALAACGKRGPPEPAGPADKITWPHGYPTPHPTAPPP
jgi:predicted small lipoprotein YifL